MRQSVMQNIDAIRAYLTNKEGFGTAQDSLEHLDSLELYLEDYGKELAAWRGECFLACGQLSPAGLRNALRDFISIAEHKRLLAEALAPTANPTPPPSVGSRWTHENEHLYTVLAVANLDSDRPSFPVTVVYQDEDGRVWSRPLSRWGSMISLGI